MNTPTPSTDSAPSNSAGLPPASDDNGSPAAAPQHQPIEQLEAASGEPRYLLAAVRAARRWLPGQELTAAEFAAALEAVKGREVT